MCRQSSSHSYTNTLIHSSNSIKFLRSLREQLTELHSFDLGVVANPKTLQGYSFRVDALERLLLARQQEVSVCVCSRGRERERMEDPFYTTHHKLKTHLHPHTRTAATLQSLWSCSCSNSNSSHSHVHHPKRRRRQVPPHGSSSSKQTTSRPTRTRRGGKWL